MAIFVTFSAQVKTILVVRVCFVPKIGRTLVGFPKYTFSRISLVVKNRVEGKRGLKTE